MAENDTMVIPETDIEALKEALCAQQQLLQQIYAEFDVEREAAATAASEALSMILRLQGEKASLKMEAIQYKRMAEEKMCHAEEALEIFEDLIYQREMEIASLEFQVQAYRHRILSMGCSDLGVCENKFPENLLMQINEAVFGEKGVSNTVRRLNSLPPIPIKDSDCKKSIIERKRSVTPLPDSNPSPVCESAGQEAYASEGKTGSATGGDMNSYWEHIRKLDVRVKEILESKDSGKNKSAIWKGGTWSPSLFSQVSIGTSVDPTRGVNAINSGKEALANHENSQEKEIDADSACSLTVQDIFEVPLATESGGAYEPEKKQFNRLTLQDENRLGKQDLISQDALRSPGEDIIDSEQTTLLFTGHEKKPPKPADRICLDRTMSVGRPPISATNSPAGYQQLCLRMERLERASNNVRKEIVSQRQDGLNLLKEIREQLKSMQQEMRSRKSEKSHIPKQPCLDSLKEAMTYFWF